MGKPGKSVYDVCYTYSQLLGRKWTDLLTEQLLGKPDIIKEYEKGKATRLYIKRRVWEAEKHPRFKTLKRIREAHENAERKKAGKERIDEYE